MCKSRGSLAGLVSISHKHVGMVGPLSNTGVAAPSVTWSQTRCMHFDGGGTMELIRRTVGGHLSRKLTQLKPHPCARLLKKRQRWSAPNSHQSLWVRCFDIHLFYLIFPSFCLILCFSRIAHSLQFLQSSYNFCSALSM